MTPLIRHESIFPERPEVTLHCRLREARLPHNLPASWELPCIGKRIAHKQLDSRSCCLPLYSSPSMCFPHRVTLGLSVVTVWVGFPAFCGFLSPLHPIVARALRSLCLLHALGPMRLCMSRFWTV